MKREFIPSVNFHLWVPCNMRCKFCFATFQDVKQSTLPSGHLSREQSIEVVLQLAKAGFEKITFAGGEPTLCPWLPELIKTAKQSGMRTMIVTNGSRLNDDFFKQNQTWLDWIAISIDSLSQETNLAMGRAIGGKRPLPIEYYKSLTEKVKQFGYGLKINTVVNRHNFMEEMNEFIQFAKPKRWKIFQALPIHGQNDEGIDEMAISTAEFEQFVCSHQISSANTILVPESNNQMQGSYAMVDPAGRFFDNAKGYHHYSSPILEVGISKALEEVQFDFQKFTKRGGIYDWKINKSAIPLKITLSGEVASGKSTIGKLLAEKLNFKFVSLGDKTREMAAKKGISIVEFQRECKNNPDLDLKIDREFSEECNCREGIIVDYRLGFKFIKNGFHIFLKIKEETAITRLKSANRFNETFATVRERNDSFRNQFQLAYGVDYTDETNYNLVIEVDNSQSVETVTDLIIRHIGGISNH